MKQHPAAMREHGAIVQHPFGTLKRWAGIEQISGVRH